jgi:hypothetical protein
VHRSYKFTGLLPWRPSEFSPGLLVAAALSRRRRPLGISRSSRGHPARYRSYWFCGPTSPLAIPSAVWFSHTGVRRTVQHSRRRLSEFGLPPECCPAQASPPLRADSSLGLSLPSAHARHGGPLTAGTPARYVPPSGFGYPRGGLRPPRPGRVCFTPAALMGFALRSFLLPKGTRRVSATGEPTCRFACRFSLSPRATGPAPQAAAPGL